MELSFATSDDLIGYTDADWAGNPINRRSISGFTYTFAGGAVSWSSKGQRSVALSSTEAEYMAATQATKEAVWFRMLMKEIGYISTDIPTTLLVDNQSCMALAKNPAYHARTKHIDVQHHFIRDKVEDKEVELKYCNTGDMVADFLMKAIPKEKFQKCRNGVGLRTYIQSGSDR